MSTMDFFREFENLRRRTPRIALINVDSQNSDYCSHADKNKNCYLVHAANFNEMRSKGDYGKTLETTYRFEDTRAYEDF